MEKVKKVSSEEAVEKEMGIGRGGGGGLLS